MGNALRDRATLYYPLEPRNGTIDHNLLGDEYRKIYTREIMTTSKEIYAAMSENSDMTKKFKCRYDSKINTKMKLSYNREIYDILGISDAVGYHKFIYLICRKID